MTQPGGLELVDGLPVKPFLAQTAEVKQIVIHLSKFTGLAVRSNRARGAVTRDFPWEQVCVRDDETRAERRDGLSHIDVPPVGAHRQTR